ncbi:MAG: DUF5320 domain-containing protein [Eubacteriales bacterium]|nr:DUF5320 domain-containing protein [Eubacteriales bacterium]
MPGGDRTGPAGAGPMTGRRAGYCAGSAVPGYANPGPGAVYGRGFGFGRGLGFGRGFGFGYRMPWGAANYTPGNFAGQTAPVDEAAALKSQAEYFESQLKEIKDRISEIEKDG